MGKRGRIIRSMAAWERQADEAFVKFAKLDLKSGMIAEAAYQVVGERWRRHPPLAELYKSSGSPGPDVMVPFAAGVQLAPDPEYENEPEKREATT